MWYKIKLCAWKMHNKPPFDKAYFVIILCAVPFIIFIFVVISVECYHYHIVYGVGCS